MCPAGVLSGNPLADGRGERPGGILLGFTAEILVPMTVGKLNPAGATPAPGGARDVSQPEPKAVAGRVRRDEARVGTIEGSRDAAGPHPIYPR